MRTTMATIMALLWALLLLANVITGFVHILLLGAIGLFLWSIAYRRPST